MQPDNTVEWDLVDYGSAVFHVASLQSTAATETESQSAGVPLDAPAEREQVSIPDCFFLRCWSAFRDCHKAA